MKGQGRIKLTSCVECGAEMITTRPKNTKSCWECIKKRMQVKLKEEEDI